MQNCHPEKTPLQCISAQVHALAHDEQGESITETLVSVLIGGLALLMLAIVLATSAHLVSDSRRALNEYYTATNNIALATSGNASGTVTVSLTAVDAVGGTSELASMDANVDYNVSTVSGKTVVSYHRNTN